MSSDLAQLAMQLGACLEAAGWRLTAAESCTGGWIAKCLTDIAGSSRWFECGFVTYSNAAKQALLGVEEATLSTEGAVSEAVVREMALGALSRSRAEVAVAVSGIAGPDGGTMTKPVGTVCFGFALAERVDTETVRFDGDRAAVRQASVAHALLGLIERCGGG